MPRIARHAQTPAVQVLMQGGKALGMSGATLAILEALSRSPLVQGDLEQATGLTRATLSKHLRALEDAGFVSASTPKGERRGPTGTVWSLERRSVAEWLESARRLLTMTRSRDREHAPHHRDDAHHNAR